MRLTSHRLKTTTSIISWLIMNASLICTAQSVDEISSTAPSSKIIIDTPLALKLVKQEDSSDFVSHLEETQLESDLEKAESKDSRKSEIIKQIRKLNNDGSYTVGYEADDGTFKIESRDVLGNVKGTYGYVDTNGEIQRVAYTGNNSSIDLKSTVQPVPSSDEVVVHIPARQNRTNVISSPTTRRPASLAFLTSTASTPTRASVIQSIPKRRYFGSGTSTDRSPYNNQYVSFSRHDRGDRSTTPLPRRSEPTTTVVYATSITSSTPKPVITHSRSTPISGTTFKTVEQISRPEKLEIADQTSKVQISNQRELSTVKPVVEIVDEKGSERRPLISGNSLRRQLADDTGEKFEAQQRIIYGQSAGEDSSHIYGGVTGNIRPLFTTTATPRIPSVVLAARARAANLQNTLNNYARKQQQKSGGTDRVYSNPPIRKHEESTDEEEKIDEQNSEPATESTSENKFLTQSPIRAQIPASQTIEQASEDDGRVLRRPIGYPPQYRAQREFVRQAPPGFDYMSGPRQFRIPIPPVYQGGRPEPEQYLRETSRIKESQGTAAPTEPYPAGDPNGGPFPGQLRRPGGPVPYSPYQTPSATGNGYDQQASYPVPFAPQNPYGPYGRSPGPYNSNLDRPLTVRDFERLLNLLVYRHQQLNSFGYGGNNFQNPYQGYQNPYLIGAGSQYQQIPRPPIYNQFDPRYGGYNRSPYGQYSEQEPYSAQNSPSDQPYAGQRLTPRKRQYGVQYFGAQSATYPDVPDYGDGQQGTQQQEYLPPDVREELLYRMLMLAIQSEQLQAQRGGGGLPPGGIPGGIPQASTQEYVSSSNQEETEDNDSKQISTSSSPVKFHKPIRSVQILGEE